MESMIQLIEELSLNSWPALNTSYKNGWIIRSSDGYTRRSNCAIPLYDQSGSVEEMVKYCENYYQRQEQKTIIKLYNQDCEKIDHFLQMRGYQKEATTLVMKLNLQDIQLTSFENIIIRDGINKKWLKLFKQFKNLTPGDHQKHISILNKISLPCLTGIIYHHRQPVGIILGVIEQETIGIYDLHIKEKFQQMGLGYKLLNTLLNHTIQYGVHNSYLNVMAQNSNAVKLYQKLNYQTLYQYWYRVK